MDNNSFGRLVNPDINMMLRMANAPRNWHEVVIARAFLMGMLAGLKSNLSQQAEKEYEKKIDRLNGLKQCRYCSDEGEQSTCHYCGATGIARDDDLDNSPSGGPDDEDYFSFAD